jgi:4-amino-4-deoxy-L-arabinose transferase-like glycosyltransferase
MPTSYRSSTLSRLIPAVFLLLVLFLTRLHALDSFPFHVDEGIHTRWAVEVWRGHPFWYISDAKIIAHWPIAAFYPQNAPTFVARVPTVLIGLVGLAAGYALTLRLFGIGTAVLAGVLWITSPYLFFYERLALMDAEIGGLGVLALWASVMLARRGTVRNAILAGVTLALAILFKLTAAAFLPMIVILPLVNARYPFSRRLKLAGIAALACAACFIVPLAYMLLKAENFFNVPRQFIGIGSGGGGSLVKQFLANIDKLWLQLVGFAQPAWVIALLVGLVALAVFGGRWGRLLLVGAGLSLALILLIGKIVFPRYYVALLPTALVLAGAGIGLALDAVNQSVFVGADQRIRPHLRNRLWLLPALLTLLLSIGVLPFMLTAYNDPAGLTLSDAMREQNYTGPSAGFGLREAVLALPDILAGRDIPVIASMRPDSCIQANYYARTGWMLTCTDAPGVEAINAALADYRAVYVLTDHAPLIGVDVSTLDAVATHIADFPRPGETAPSIVLWLLEK